MKRLLLSVAIIAATLATATPAPVGAAVERPRIDHVVVVVLENTTAEEVLDKKKADALTTAYGPEIYGGVAPELIPSKPLPAKRAMWKNVLIAVLAIFVLVRVWFMVRIMRQRRARKTR